MKLINTRIAATLVVGTVVNAAPVLGMDVVGIYKRGDAEALTSAMQVLERCGGTGEAEKAQVQFHPELSYSDLLHLMPGDTLKPDFQERLLELHWPLVREALKRHLVSIGKLGEFRKNNPELGNLFDVELPPSMLPKELPPATILQKVTGFLSALKP